MIIINSLNDSRFTLNGIPYFKNYITRVAGNSLILYNVYNNKDVLVPYTSYDQFSVNGSVYNTIEQLQSAIMGVCYIRTTLDEGSLYYQNNIGRVINIGAVIPTWDGTGSYLYPAADNYTVDVAAKLNQYEYTITATETPVIVIANIVTDTGSILYKYIFKAGKGTWGSHSNPFAYYMLEYITKQNFTATDVEENPSTNIISLGNLPNGDYLTAANTTEHDFSDSGSLNENEEVIAYYFSYITNEVLYFIQFVGLPDIYNGTLTEDDLALSTNSDISANTDYESILQSGNIALTSALHKDVESGMITEFLGKGFSATQNDLTQKFVIEQPLGNFTVSLPAATDSDSVVYATKLQQGLDSMDLQSVLENGSEVYLTNQQFNIQTANNEISKGAFGLNENGFILDGQMGGINIYGGGEGITIIPQAGFKYAYDDSTNYTNRSLVDKEYVDHVLASQTSVLDLQSITDNGNTTTNDIFFNAENSIGIKAQAGGQITFNNTNGVSILGNGGVVSIGGNNLGVIISGHSGGINLLGGAEGIIINGESGNVSISAGGSLNLDINSNDIIVTTPNSSIKYFSDYSDTYTNRSLVDKGYVDNFTSNFIPLSGTEAGSPISGNIEVSESIGLFHDNGTYSSIIALEDGGFIFSGVNSDGHVTGFTVSQDSNFFIHSNNPNSRGLVSDDDFTLNITDLDYVQKKYVDNSLPSGSGFGYWNGTDITWLNGNSQQMLLSDGTVADIDTKMRAQYIGSNTDSNTQLTTSTNFQTGLWSLQEQINFTNISIQQVKDTTPLIIINDVIDSVTLNNSISETVLKSYLIQANKLSEGSLQLSATFEKAGVNGNASHQIYINTSNSLTGATRIGTLETNSPNQLFNFLKREYIIKSGNILFGYPAFESHNNGDAGSSSAPLNSSIDISSDIYIIISGILDNSGDSLIQKSFTMEYKPAI